MTMDLNNVLESSATLALTGLNVVIEDESEYVFVAGDAEVNLDEWDDDEWTNCDLSPSLSCATSVTSSALNLIEDSAMMDVDDDGRTAMETDEARDDGNQTMSEDANGKVFAMANPKNGRRLSNKKLRKKMKMMKKAAAARAAAEALANQKASMASSSSSSSSTAMSEDLPAPVVPKTRATNSGKSNTTSPQRRTRSMNIAVACAHESLAAYREEIEAGKARLKKTRAVSIDL